MLHQSDLSTATPISIGKDQCPWDIHAHHSRRGFIIFQEEGLSL
jgi:hypothetical protein